MLYTLFLVFEYHPLAGSLPMPCVPPSGVSLGYVPVSCLCTAAGAVGTVLGVLFGLTVPGPQGCLPARQYHAFTVCLLG